MVESRFSMLPEKSLFWLQLILLVVLTFLAILFRRPDQFFHPYVWAEDGVLILPDFAASGWRTILHPIAGYFILPAKLIFAISATISFRWLPEISYWITVAFAAFVVTAIAFSPTQLRYSKACALAPLLIPIDSEVYGVSLFSGWWGTLLAVLPLLWRADGLQKTTYRLTLLVVGGLSSPLIIGLSPLYALRAVREQTRSSVVDLGVCLLLAAIQASSLLFTQQMPVAGSFELAPILLIEKFFGDFLLVASTPAQLPEAFFLGVALLAFLFYGCWKQRNSLGIPFLLLLGCFSVSLLLSIARQPLSAIHPSLGGPRYFFLPYTFLAWIIIQLVSVSEGITRVIALSLLAIATKNTFHVAQRRHDSIDWRAQVTECGNSLSYSLPIHVAGSKEFLWHVDMTGADCRRLVRHSWFDNDDEFVR